MENATVATNSSRSPASGLDILEILSRYPEFVIAKDLNAVYPLVFTVLGVIGNLLSFVVLTRKNMRSSSSCVYLAALALSDLFYLLFFYASTLPVVHFRKYIQLWMCTVPSFLQSAAAHCSAVLICEMTIERFIAIKFPLRARYLCTTKRALVFVGVTVAAVALANIHFFWTVTLAHKVCFLNKRDYKQFLKVWDILDMTLYCYGPLCVLFVVNGLIIHQIRSAERTQAALSSTGSHGKNAYISRMLLVISFAYLILTLPTGIFYALKNFWDYRSDFHTWAIANLINQLVQVLIAMNHSMNFLLYCATGHRWRHQLFLLMPSGCRCRSTFHNMVSKYISSSNTTLDSAGTRGTSVVSSRLSLANESSKETWAARHHTMNYDTRL